MIISKKSCLQTRLKISSPRMKSVLVTAFSPFVFASILHASEAHEHGVVTMDAVVEGKRLDVMLVTPAVNIVGFEHLPETEAQKEEVFQAINAMKQGYEVIKLPSAALCLLKDADVDQTLLELQHESEHEHEHEHEHAHEHEHEHEEEHEHADIKVHYQFACAKPSQLTTMTVGLFDQFPMIESVRYQFIGEAGQKGGTLSSSQDEISIR